MGLTWALGHQHSNVSLVIKSAHEAYQLLLVTEQIAEISQKCYFAPMTTTALGSQRTPYLTGT